MRTFRTVFFIVFCWISTDLRPIFNNGFEASEAPKRLQEQALSTFYSAAALERGRGGFEAPDLQPLPTKFERNTWHEELGDQEP